MRNNYCYCNNKKYYNKEKNQRSDAKKKRRLRAIIFLGSIEKISISKYWIRWQFHCTMIMLHYGRKGDRLRHRNPPIHRNPSATQGRRMSSTCILNISKSLSFVFGILRGPILFSPTAYYKIYNFTINKFLFRFLKHVIFELRGVSRIFFVRGRFKF